MRMEKTRNWGKGSKMHIKVLNKNYMQRYWASFCPAVKYYSWWVEFWFFCPCSNLTEQKLSWMTKKLTCTKKEWWRNIKIVPRIETSVNFMHYYFCLLLFLYPSWFFSACFTSSIHENFIRWQQSLSFPKADITESLKNSMKVYLYLVGLCLMQSFS